ncbi:AraC-like DNA-binding protein [Rhodobacter sp. JA431]|uniref:helix-turn-helix domain-containing protein n=1 Tax=Rhodobacter sp. JA431 TaxID=570013 RepID=UPI000BC9D26A|nr:AraC family transcriptional regulator [Rhodobacter sp. JA431]SOC14285.1 AraC-like DNA-binding protein [Rhodobacter sp. JA431]
MKLFNAPPLSQMATQTAPARPDDKPVSKASSAPAKPRTTLLPEAPSAPRVVPLARLTQGGRWRVEAMRAFSEPYLLWFTRGQGRITMGGVTRGYGPYTAAFIPAGVMHAFEVGLQTHGMAVFFGRNTDLALPHAAQHLRIRDTAAQAELTGLIDSVTRELESGRPGADRAASHYLGLLSVVIERQSEALPAETRPAGPTRKLVARYSALLERDFRTGHTVSDYAAQLGVTPTHLTRACRANCGRAASELLQERRLYEARRLLSETRAPVKEIAETLGFTSPAYFTRAFHSKIGKTPSQFRRGG